MWFHMKGWAPGLALKIRMWPMGGYSQCRVTPNTFYRKKANICLHGKGQPAIKQLLFFSTARKRKSDAFPAKEMVRNQSHIWRGGGGNCGLRFIRLRSGVLWRWFGAHAANFVFGVNDGRCPEQTREELANLVTSDWRVTFTLLSKMLDKRKQTSPQGLSFNQWIFVDWCKTNNRTAQQLVLPSVYQCF